ncbi:MAG: hypothetical protein ACRDDZ_10085 [Marinifilaceae bacterium]
MRRYFFNNLIKSIITLCGVIMLFSCKTDPAEVQNFIMQDSMRAVMKGEELKLIYTDSARIKYRILTPEYIKGGLAEKQYEEFPKGVEIFSYDKEGNLVASIKAKYAKKMEKDMLWEARHDVVVVNSEGKKLETELLFWDMKNERIFSDRYTRLTADEQIMEGNNGFESDQNLNYVVFRNVTGEVPVEAPQ